MPPRRDEQAEKDEAHREHVRGEDVGETEPTRGLSLHEAAFIGQRHGRIGKPPLGVEELGFVGEIGRDSVGMLDLELEHRLHRQRGHCAHQDRHEKATGTGVET